MSADDVENMAALQTKLPAITLLTDPRLDGLRAWGVLVQGAEQPSPATFVIGADGVVSWRKTLDAGGDWPTYAELSSAL